MSKRRDPRSVAELRDDAAGYLETYTAPAGHYAFATYDQSPIHDGDITPADVLMANLLSLRLRWREVTPLFATGGDGARFLEALNSALAEARGLPPLEDCTEEQVAMPNLRRVNEMTATYPGWTNVTVSKVLHRLAPTVPLIDSRIRQFYGVKQGGALRRLIRADLMANRGWLGELAEKHPVRGEPMALTRVADIAIWMDSKAG